MKILKPFILLILNCEKYRKKAENQKKTWLKNIENDTDIDYFHIIGNKDKCSNKEYYFDNDNRILYTSTNDDYLSLPHKIITAMKAIHDTYDYKYIFKTDDDQMLIEPNFFNTLKTLLIKSVYHYGGYKLNVPDHISTYYLVHDILPRDLFLKGTEYCNGRFYLLSKSAVENLLIKQKQISKHIIEDHAIGLYLDDEYKKKCLVFNSKKYFIDDT